MSQARTARANKLNQIEPNRNERVKSKNKSPGLADLAGWDVKTIQTLKNYVASFQSIPSTRALVTSMIEFSQMYQDIHKSPFSTNFWTDFEGINEYRRGQRARIQLCKKDLLESVDGVNGKTLVLTSRARKIFYQEYPLAQLRKQKWNGEWTLVSYDLPENLRVERNYLHTKLVRLGFGCLQKSFLVSPLPLEEAVQELVEGQELTAHVVVLTAKRVLGLTDEEMGAAAWNLKELGDQYSKLLEVLPKVKKSKDKELLEQWRTYFLAVNFKDPYLPFELLPSDWPGEKCKKEFQKLGLPGLLRIIFGK